MHRILKIFCVISVLMISVFITGCKKAEESGFQAVSFEELDEEGTADEDEEVAVKAEDTGTIFIHVCGAVHNPGVYELRTGSRIYEAIKEAGGMTALAAEHSVNQAEVLIDGQQIYIPSEEELQNQTSETGVTSDGKLDINKATKEELMTLSGIGEAKADAIIAYREKNKGFKSIEEIMEIEGIKEGVFRKIEDRIKVS